MTKLEISSKHLARARSLSKMINFQLKKLEELYEIRRVRSHEPVNTDNSDLSEFHTSEAARLTRKLNELMVVYQQDED